MLSNGQGYLRKCARSFALSQKVAYIANLMDTAGGKCVVCDMPYAYKLTLQLLAVVAKHEGEMISRRTKEALRGIIGTQNL